MIGTIFDQIALGFATAISWQALLYCFVGVFLGTLIGVLPGVGAFATIAIGSESWSCQ